MTCFRTLNRLKLVQKREDGIWWPINKYIAEKVDAESRKKLKTMSQKKKYITDVPGMHSAT